MIGRVDGAEDSSADGGEERVDLFCRVLQGGKRSTRKKEGEATERRERERRKGDEKEDKGGLVLVPLGARGLSFFSPLSPRERGLRAVLQLCRGRRARERGASKSGERKGRIDDDDDEGGNLRRGLPLSSRSLFFSFPATRERATIAILSAPRVRMLLTLSSLRALAETEENREMEREKKEKKKGVSMAAAAEARVFLFSLSLSPSLASFSLSPFVTYVGLDPAPLVSDSRDLGGDAGHGAAACLT